MGAHKILCSVFECDVVQALVCSRVWWDVSQRHTHCNCKRVCCCRGFNNGKR